MKISRLITYGITGIIVGLLIENQALAMEQRLLRKAIQKKKDKLKAAEQEPKS